MVAVVAVEARSRTSQNRAEQQFAAGRQQRAGNEDRGQDGGHHYVDQWATGPLAATAARSASTSSTRRTATR